MERIRQVMADVMLLDDAERDAIDAHTGMDNFEKWDSLSHIGLITALEERFAIRMSAGEVVEIQNMGQLLAVLARHGVHIQP